MILKFRIPKYCNSHFKTELHVTVHRASKTVQRGGIANSVDFFDNMSLVVRKPVFGVSDWV